MTNSQSKLFFSPVDCTCQKFQHPWTDKCVNASAGLLLNAIPYCLRVYTVVYVVSLLMRRRIPTLEDLKRTVMGILQSSGFLVTNAFTFIMYNCIIRNVIGRYYLSTVAFIPCFLASWTAIVVERPARRPMLTLYVANLATEALWNMAERRGWVRSIPNGQAIIFGAGVSVLLYLYRLGLHKTDCKDSIFNILKIFVGKTEEGPFPDNKAEQAEATASSSRRSRAPLNFRSTMVLLQLYGRLMDVVNGKHESCKHSEGCIKYSLLGGLKPLAGGIGLQVALKLLMNIKRVATLKFDWRKNLMNKSTLNIGLFLGSFSFLYKAVSCILRHGYGFDDPRFAIPAGLIGSVAFVQYPDTTVALYVLWKMLQLVYNLGIDRGVLPRVPGFTLFLYSFATATLFHAGILEAETLRPSYYKFLQAISGERLSKFDVTAFDVYGLGSTESATKVLKNLKITNPSPYPKFALV